MIIDLNLLFEVVRADSYSLLETSQTVYLIICSSFCQSMLWYIKFCSSGCKLSVALLEIRAG